MSEEEDSPYQIASAELMRKMTATEVNRRTKEAVAYFSGANSAKGPSTGRVNLSVISKGRRGATDVVPGQLFAFSYHAKHAETLKYWDRFPLMLFLDAQKNGNLLGLNLHYLPPPARAVILGRLMSAMTAKKMRHDARMRITYGMVRSIAEYQPLQFCIKSYIPGNVAGKIVRIPASGWKHSVFVPYEAFQKASSRTVWAESRRH